MKYLCNVSGGLCSFWAWKRTIDQFGAANVVPIFADVMIEDKDLYAFNEQAAAHLGTPITRISLELSPWELFRREGLLGNNRFPICSTKLKREPLNAWMAGRYELNRNQTNAFLEEGTVVLGFDWTEHHRVDEFQAAHPTWRVLAPMTEKPLWDKCRMMVEAEALGFARQRLYALGFPHANCGGGCVKAGISHFVNLYHRLPEVFWKWAAEELYTRDSMRAQGIEKWHFTILKDRRGKETKPLLLMELAYRIAAGEDLPKDEWGGCGCGGAETIN